MGDIYKEQIVKKVSTPVDMAKRAGLVILVIAVFLITSVFIPSFAFILAFAAGIGAYFLNSFLNMEYEYVFTNGELDIDIIYSRSRRKRVYSGYLKDIEIMAHIDDNDHKTEFSTVQEMKDYSSGVKGNNTYVFLTMYKGKRIKILIEPNEMMIQAFKTVLTPRKLFLKS